MIPCCSSLVYNECDYSYWTEAQSNPVLETKEIYCWQQNEGRLLYFWPCGEFCCIVIAEYFRSSFFFFMVASAQHRTCLLLGILCRTTILPSLKSEYVTPHPKYMYYVLFVLHPFVSYIEHITWWHEDMNFIFEWQNNILRTSAASE